MSIDLNADVGEGHDDLPIFSFVTSVSVACGAHAGDEASMERSIAEAARLGVVVGAHPGYPDREGFGRHPMEMAPDELRASLVEQIRALAAVGARHGVRLAHVKPHGALYNQGAVDPALAAVVVAAMIAVDPTLRLVGLPGSAFADAASEAGLRFTAESFADRRYLSNGHLASRSRPDALILNPTEAATQAVALATRTPIPAVDGGTIKVNAETICVHADTPGAFEMTRTIRGALDRAGVVIRAFGSG